MQQSSPSFLDWLPPRKLFYFQLGTGFQPHNLGILRLKSKFEALGYESIRIKQSITTMMASIASGLRPCDVVVIYISGLGHDRSPRNIPDIYTSIVTQSWNGATVTFIFDTLITDMAKAPQNFVVDGRKSVISNGTMTLGEWPKEVKVLYAGSKTISPRLLPECLLKAGSFAYQSSWLAAAISQCIDRTPIDRITYKDLLIGIQRFNTSVTRADLTTRLKDVETHHINFASSVLQITTPDFGVVGMWNVDLAAADIVRARKPMIGASDITVLDNKAFVPAPWVPPRQDTPIKKAVLVGITYSTEGEAPSVDMDISGVKFGAKQLKSPVNDVKLMYKVLVEKRGFLPKNVVTLTGSVKKIQIAQALNWLMSDNDSRNTLVFYYSGHGTQIKDVSGDETDGMDEALVTQESNTEAGLLVDDELNSLLVQSNNTNTPLYCFFDCCHSGSICDAQFIETPTTPRLGSLISLKKTAIAPTHVYAATFDASTTFEFHPKDVHLIVPEPPKDQQWDDMENPAFGCFTYGLWSTLSSRKNNSSITHQELLASLARFYKTRPCEQQLSCVPIYSTTVSGAATSIISL